MTRELQAGLVDRYPWMFRELHKPMSETCMCWGLEVGDGWYPLLECMCRRLSVLEQRHDLHVVFDQTKEKWGVLRVYHHLEYGGSWLNEMKLGHCPSALPPCSPVRGRWMPRIYVGFWVRDWVRWLKQAARWLVIGRRVGRTLRRLSAEFDQVVSQAETASGEVCEICGAYGRVNGSGWLSCRCVRCREKLEGVADEKEKGTEDRGEDPARVQDPL